MSSRTLLSVLSMFLTAALAPVPSAAQTGGKANWQAEYNDLVAKAKKEGEVVVYGGSGRERRRARTQPFEQKYGIKVSYVGGRTNAIVEKIKAEQGAGIYQGDVYFGRPPEVARLLKENALAPLKPLFFLPEVTDPSGFYQHKHWYTDPKQEYGLITAAYQSNVISFNSKRVNPDSFHSMWDLLKPEYKGRLIISEPEPGAGANGVLVWMYVSKKLGPEFIRRLLTEAKPAFQQDCRQAVDLLAKGVYDFGLFCYSDVRRAQKQGLPVKNRVEPVKEGSILAMGGSNELAVLTRAPHPNAQKLYVNWWFSKEGQISFQKLDREYQSVRNDIPTDPVPDSRLRKPGVDYVYPDAEVEGAKWASEANALWWKIRKSTR